MKMHIRSRIFLPVLLVLLVLPLAVWLVFGAVSQRYMERISQLEINMLLENVQQIAEASFISSDKTPNKEPERTQSKTFVADVKKMLRQTQNDAQLMILTTKLELIYPKDLDSQPDARVLYTYLTYTLDVKELENPDFQLIVLDERGYLIRVRQMNNSANVRAKYLIAYNPLYDTSALRNSIGRLALLITAALAGLSLIVVWRTAGSIAKPMKRLCDTAFQIGKGDFHCLEEKSRLCEIDELTTAMSEMSGQLEHAEDMQKTFLQNASHELRTPLMSISGYAQGMQCGVFADIAEPIDAILSESLRLTELVDELLSLSRMDCEKELLELRTLNLTELVGSCLEQLGGIALERGVRFVVPAQDTEIMVRADEKLFARAFSNVAANGIRFAKSTLTVYLFQTARQVTVTVEDDGDGIAFEDREHLFERFYKGNRGNCGLGLAIAKVSMEYMGGGIRLCDRTHGAAFELVLKIDRER